MASNDGIYDIEHNPSGYFNQRVNFTSGEFDSNYTYYLGSVIEQIYENYSNLVTGTLSQIVSDIHASWTFMGHHTGHHIRGLEHLGEFPEWLAEDPKLAKMSGLKANIISAVAISDYANSIDHGDEADFDLSLDMAMGLYDALKEDFDKMATMTEAEREQTIQEAEDAGLHTWDNTIIDQMMVLLSVGVLPLNMIRELHENYN